MSPASPALSSHPSLDKSHAALLTASGIRSIADLARSQPDKLWRWMEEVNAEQRLVRKMPTLEAVRGWIREAQEGATAAA